MNERKGKREGGGREKKGGEFRGRKREERKGKERGERVDVAEMKTRSCGG